MCSGLSRATCSAQTRCFLMGVQAAALPDGGGLAVHGGNAPDNSRLRDMWLLERDT